MRKPLLIIVNGLPGAGKTTLARRLAADLALPVFSRDGLYEILYDQLADDLGEQSPLLGAASYALLYQFAGAVLAAGQSVIVEGFFGRPELRTAQFLRLRQAHDFEPLQVMCTASGRVLMERFLARATSGERHPGHRDLEWLQQNEARLLHGELTPLTLGSLTITFDTTAGDHLAYADIVQRVRAMA